MSGVPEVAILHLRMPDADGARVTEHALAVFQDMITTALAPTKVKVVVTHGDSDVRLLHKVDARNELLMSKAKTLLKLAQEERIGLELTERIDRFLELVKDVPEDI